MIIITFLKDKFFSDIVNSKTKIEAVMKITRILIFIIFISLTLPVASLPADDSLGGYCVILNEWEHLYTQDNITVYSQKVPDSDIVALKAVGILKAPMDQVVEVLRKVEISKEWVPHIEKKFAVQEFSDTESITYSVNMLPWPFSDRSLLLYNKLRFDKEKNHLVIDIQSVEPEKIPIKEDNVRAKMHCGQMIIRPANTVQTDIQLVVFVDPKGHIPAWLVNLSQKRLPYDFLKALEKKAGGTHFELRPTFKEMFDQLFGLSG